MIESLITDVLSVFNFYYIFAVTFGVYFVIKNLEKYVPALTPARIAGAVQAATNPIVALAKQDWRKWVTLGVGTGIGYLYYVMSWIDGHALLPSFLFAQFSWSYIMKYLAKGIKRLDYDR